MPKLILKGGTSSELTVKDGNSSDLIDTSSGLFVKDGASSDNSNDVRVCMAKTGVTGGGYVMGWDFHECQTCAARNFLALIDWACDLNLTVVEPCVYNSYFNVANCVDMLNQASNSRRPLTFRDYFDIDYWNNRLL